MSLLLVGLALFLGVHSTAILAPRWRQRTIERIGSGPWKGLYALIASIGFVLIIYGYGMARQQPIQLYTPPAWARHVALGLLLPVFPLIFAAYLPGRISATLKHPMLAATKLWALAHLLSNGTLADVLLFGGLLAWAVADRISFKRRSQPDLRTAPRGRFNDMIAVVLGIVTYLVFTKWLHLWWIGVYPLPM
jgi:uncharacterized membrane protein